MSEAKNVIIGILGAILGIAVLFALVLMLAGKGDELVAPTAATTRTTIQTCPTETGTCPASTGSDRASVRFQDANRAQANNGRSPLTPFRGTPSLVRRPCFWHHGQGIPRYVGPRGGFYPSRKSGKKVYERRR